MEKQYLNNNFINNFYNKVTSGVVPGVFSLSLPMALIHKAMISNAESFYKERYDMLKSEVDVLAVLYTNGKILSPTQLYDLTIFSSGGMTKILKKLESRELISRKADENDKRCMLVCLSEHGESTIKKVLDEASKECNNYFDVLDEKERELLSSMLKKVLLNVNKATCSIEESK